MQGNIDFSGGMTKVNYTECTTQNLLIFAQIIQSFFVVGIPFPLEIVVLTNDYMVSYFCSECGFFSKEGSGGDGKCSPKSLIFSGIF